MGTSLLPFFALLLACASLFLDFQLLDSDLLRISLRFRLEILFDDAENEISIKKKGGKGRKRRGVKVVWRRVGKVVKG